jgi:hypothetical protein
MAVGQAELISIKIKKTILNNALNLFYLISYTCLILLTFLNTLLLFSFLQNKKKICATSLISSLCWLSYCVFIKFIVIKLLLFYIV